MTTTMLQKIFKDVLNDDKITGALFLVGLYYEKSNVFSYKETINRMESLGNVSEFENFSLTKNKDRSAVLVAKSYQIGNLSNILSLPFIYQY